MHVVRPIDRHLQSEKNLIGKVAIHDESNVGRLPSDEAERPTVQRLANGARLTSQALYGNGRHDPRPL
jgi:hypothetical protein